MYINWLCFISKPAPHWVKPHYIFLHNICSYFLIAVWRGSRSFLGKLKNVISKGSLENSQRLSQFVLQKHAPSNHRLLRAVRPHTLDFVFIFTCLLLFFPPSSRRCYLVQLYPNISFLCWQTLSVRWRVRINWTYARE